MSKTNGLVKSKSFRVFEALDESPVSRVWKTVNPKRSLSDNITEIELNAYSSIREETKKFMLYLLVPIGFILLSVSLYLTDVVSGFMLSSMLLLSLIQVGINRELYRSKMVTLYSQWSYSVNSLISSHARQEFFYGISQAMHDEDESEKVNTNLLAGYVSTHMFVCDKVQEIIDKVNIK